MARFKLVRIGKKGKKRVEVQKVHFKLHFGALVFALICAFLVWFYVKGSTPPALEPPRPEETTPRETAEVSDVTTADTVYEAAMSLCGEIFCFVDMGEGVHQDA
ncbi:MAG: hypothetical protein IJW00_02100 [Clostridia bacterium]|nr:hypothetical protein [Clostridia bacterium]